jgi:hypothetical protein
MHPSNQTRRTSRASRFRRARAVSWLWALVAPALVAPALGCHAIRPSNALDWSPDQARLAHAEFDGDQVTVHNVRNCTYLSTDDYVVNWDDRTYDLNKLDRVDFIKVPFKEMPLLAHTMLSFGFQDGEHLAVSVEVRKRKGQTYSAAKGAARQFHIMYVVADERDALKLRTNYRHDDVYLYLAKATPEQARALFVDVMTRVNKLYREPEFYDTFTNNCTTNIAQHINNLRPGRVPLGPEVLVNGYSDRLAYDLGLLDTDKPFEQARAAAEIGHVARALPDHVDFSSSIRR